MNVVDKPRKKRIFIASSQADVAEVQKAMQQFDLDAVTLEQTATPGTTWVDSLHRCLNDADMVIGIMGDRRKDTNVFFELGVASALNKPTLLFITPDYPIDLIPPSGIPYLRMDLRNEDAVMFGLKQALSLSPRDRIHQPAEGFTTRPIGPVADQLLAKLAQASPREFEDLIYDAIKASGAHDDRPRQRSRRQGHRLRRLVERPGTDDYQPPADRVQIQPPQPVRRQRSDRPNVSCLGGDPQRLRDRVVQGGGEGVEGGTQVSPRRLRLGGRVH